MICQDRVGEAITVTRGVLCENSDISYKDKDKDKVAALKITLVS